MASNEAIGDNDNLELENNEQYDDSYPDYTEQGITNENKTSKKRKKISLKDAVYYCDLCDWTGKHTSYFNHRKYKHEGVSYPCDQCDYAGTSEGLKHHKQSKHSGRRIYQILKLIRFF